MKTIKVLGPGCSKCKTTFTNVETAVKQLNIEAEVIKIEDIEEMMLYYKKPNYENANFSTIYVFCSYFVYVLPWQCSK